MPREGAEEDYTIPLSLRRGAGTDDGTKRPRERDPRREEGRGSGDMDIAAVIPPGSISRRDDRKR